MTPEMRRVVAEAETAARNGWSDESVKSLTKAANELRCDANDVARLLALPAADHVLPNCASERRRPTARRFMGRGTPMTTAILLVEARGQSVHCREDACVNLVQAAWLARELVRAGVDVRLRLIADAGQSIEE